MQHLFFTGQAVMKHIKLYSNISLQETMTYQTATVCGIVGVGLELCRNDVILSMLHRTILFMDEGQASCCPGMVVMKPQHLQHK
jgi:hypothetical protein